MIKLYKRNEGVLRYHEAWINGETIYEHWGVVGERGETKKHTYIKGTDKNTAISEVLRSAAEKGFNPIEMEDHITLLIEYPVVGMGTTKDVEKRHKLENRMKETLGWTALGDCDGGSIGSGTMEVCCFVVDFELAKRVIATDLKDTEFSDFTRIFDESAN